jgi:uncharacterized protein
VSKSAFLTHIDTRHGRSPIARFDAPLTIGVIADTHVWLNGPRRLPVEVVDLFRRFEVGLICHAGDINDQSVLATLSRVAPMLAVRGNNDVARLKESLPATLEFCVDRVRIGMVHGDGGRSAREVSRTVFSNQVDLVIYGHSHIPKIETVEHVIYFNPGSPTDRRFGPHFGVGLITIIEGRILPELVLFDDPAHLANVAPLDRRSPLAMRSVG